MGYRDETTRPLFGATDYCVVVGLAIAWQYFRGDFFARYLCFDISEVPGETARLFYYCFLTALALFAILYPAFHEQVDRLFSKPGSSWLLLSAAASPLLMLLANTLNGTAQIVLGCLGPSTLAFYIVVAIIAWSRQLTKFDPWKIVTLVTCAFTLSSAFSYYMFLPQAAIIVLLVALPVASVALRRRSLALEQDVRTTNIGQSAVGRPESAFAMLLALFCIAAFSVRGMVVPLESASATAEFALVNACNIVIGASLLLFSSKARDVDSFLNPIAVGLMVAFFSSLCLAVVFPSTEYHPIVNAVTLVIRACLTYALFLVACLYARRSTNVRNAPLTVGLVFLIPSAFAQALRGLLFSVESIGAVYSSYVAPILSLALIVGVFLVLGPRLRLAPQTENAQARDSFSSDTPKALETNDSFACADLAQNGLPQGFDRRFDLTPREAQIASCLSRGHTLQKTAEELCISINTVRTHAKSLYRKVGIETKQQLIDLVEDWDNAK